MKGGFKIACGRMTIICESTLCGLRISHGFFFLQTLKWNLKWTASAWYCLQNLINLYNAIMQMNHLQLIIGITVSPLSAFEICTVLFWMIISGDDNISFICCFASSQITHDSFWMIISGNDNISFICWFATSQITYDSFWMIISGNEFHLLLCKLTNYTW